MRRSVFLIFIMVLLAASQARAEPVGSFSDFLKSFEAKANAAGISDNTYREATRGLKPLDHIPGLVSSQPEFETPIWEYLDKRVSDGRIARGRTAMASNRSLFQRIGQRYGVDPYVLGAIWGMETDYGSVLGSRALIKPIVPSLATLVYHRRGRLEADEAELIAALRLIQDHGWTTESLVGSWAGAIGHTQIIASGLLRHGADGDGDGRIDPHRSLADALATTATYLKAAGYKTGLDWGYEVTLPEGFDYLLASRETLWPISFFAERGVARVAGREFADTSEKVFLYVPAGHSGPKFLLTENYLVLKEYNFSDSYAFAVAHLTDRLKGSGPLVGKWPRGTKFPNRVQRVAIQEDLKMLGFYEGEVDGRLGPLTQAAYQKFQVKQGLAPDGFVTRQSFELLDRVVK